jgi:hypothetical protein
MKKRYGLFCASCAVTQALFAVGEEQKAIDLFATVRFRMRQQLRIR